MDYHVRVETEYGYRNHFVRSAESEDEAGRQAVQDAREICGADVTGAVEVTPLS